MRIFKAVHLAPIIGAFLLLLSVAPPSLAVEVGGIGFEVSLGFAGHFRPKTWVPLQVTVTNEGVPFDAHVEVVTTTGNSLTASPGQVVYRRAVSLPSGTKKQLLITLPITNIYRPLDVNLVEQSGNILQSVHIPLINSGVSSDIVLVLDTTGERWTWLQEVAQAPQGYMLRSRVYVAHAKSVPELPADWVAYESVRTIILTDSFPVSQLSSEQLQAIIWWVEAGGHLLVAGGAALSGGVVQGLAAKLPVNLTGGTRVATLQQLGYDVPNLPTPYRTVVWNASPGNGRVDLSSEGTPLIAHSWVGAGRITYLGFDLSARPLRSWRGLDAFSRNLVFPPRMVRHSTSTLERNLLPLISSQRVPYPRHLWLLLFAAIYALAIGGSLTITHTRRLGWLLLFISVLVSSLYVEFVVRRQAANVLRAYGEVRITQVPPGPGIAYSVAMAQMVSMQGGDWIIKQDPGTHLVPANTQLSDLDSVLVVEQGDVESRIGPIEARQALAVASQSLEDIDLRVHMKRNGETAYVTLENNTPWLVRNAFYVDKERYVPLGDVKAKSTSTAEFPADRFIVSSDALSPEWIAASVSTVASQDSPIVDKREVTALREIVAHALTPDRDTQDLPWGLPILIAMIDTPVKPPLAQGFTGLGYHFVIIPLNSLLEWQ